MKKPDWKCVFTYVQSFYRRFRNGRDRTSPVKTLVLERPANPANQDPAEVSALEISTPWRNPAARASEFVLKTGPVVEPFQKFAGFKIPALPKTEFAAAGGPNRFASGQLSNQNGGGNGMNVVAKNSSFVMKMQSQSAPQTPEFTNNFYPFCQTSPINPKYASEPAQKRLATPSESVQALNAASKQDNMKNILLFHSLRNKANQIAQPIRNGNAHTSTPA